MQVLEDTAAVVTVDSFCEAAREAQNADSILEFLLYALQSPINIGMILRVAETYRFRVSIYDQFRVLDHPDKLQTIADFSCGALARRGFRCLADAAAVSRMLRGRRLIATSIVPTSCPLPHFSFRSGDLFALGNEYDGLPEAFLSRADAVLHIPMPAGFAPKPKARRPIDPNRVAPVARDGQPNLNVAMTAGILCYAAYVRMLEGGRPRP
jgi:tRNA G18 (ribose-2'-O)-methylase SpoU